MNIKQHIPNVLTLINLFSGCLMVYYTLFYALTDQKFPLELNNILVVLIGISLVADFLDGLVARWLNVTSPIGMQLDSLADMVTFGLFPGFLMAYMINTLSINTTKGFSSIAFFGLLIPIFSAYRLAKFNVDTTQISYFKGLATPANAIFILGIHFILFDIPLDWLENYGVNTLISLTVISSLLLVSEIPLFSFKIKSLKLKDNIPQLLLMIFSILFILIFGLKALSAIIIIYIILSIIFKKSFTHA